MGYIGRKGKLRIPVILIGAALVSWPLSAAGQFKVKGATAGFSSAVSFGGHFGVRASVGDPSAGLTEGSRFKIGSGFLYADEEAGVPAGIEIDVNGTGEIPKVYELHQNYPNPFNPVTNILIDIPRQVHARLEIYNMLGQLVTVAVDRDLPAGTHRFEWNATDETGRAVSSGMYIYRLVAGEYSETRTMTLLK